MSGCYDRLYRLNMSRFREELVINARSVFHPCFPNLSDDDDESLSKLVEDLIADGLYILTYLSTNARSHRNIQFNYKIKRK